MFDWSKITTVIAVFQQIWPAILQAIDVLRNARPNAGQSEITQAVADHLDPTKPNAPELNG